jgi:hypothetical protein
MLFSDSVTLMSTSADLVRNIEPDRLLPPSGKLKREVSMEEIIQVAFRHYFTAEKSQYIFLSQDFLNLLAD